MSEESQVLDNTKKYLKENTGIVIPLGAIGLAAILLLGWTYTNDVRLTKVEVEQKNIEEKVDKVDETTQKIYEYLLRE